MFQDSLPITSLYFYIIQSRYFKYCPEDFISISCLPSNRSVFGNIDLFVFVFVLRNSDFICWVILYSIVYLSRMVISPLSEVKDHTNHFFSFQSTKKFISIESSWLYIFLFFFYLQSGNCFWSNFWRFHDFFLDGASSDWIIEYL